MASLMCMFSCVAFYRLNLFPYSLRTHVLLCTASSIAWLNPSRYCMHVCGFTPVCVFVCGMCIRQIQHILFCVIILIDWLNLFCTAISHMAYLLYARKTMLIHLSPSISSPVMTINLGITESERKQLQIVLVILMRPKIGTILLIRLLRSW